MMRWYLRAMPWILTAATTYEIFAQWMWGKEPFICGVFVGMMIMLFLIWTVWKTEPWRFNKEWLAKQGDFME